MSEEKEVPNDEEILKHIICETDHYCKPKDLCGNCKGTLIQIKKLLSALRASWEKEREELINYRDACELKNYAIDALTAESNSFKESWEIGIKEIAQLRAEKKGLEERVKDYALLLGRERELLEDAVKDITRLKAENAELSKTPSQYVLIHIDELSKLQAQVRIRDEALKGSDDAVIRLHEKIDTLTLALAEAHEALRDGLEACKYYSHSGVKSMSDALCNHSLQRASEEMKGLRERMKLMWEVVTYANTVRNDILIPETDDQVEMSCQCKEWVDGLLERLKALEAYERRGKGGL